MSDLTPRDIIAADGAADGDSAAGSGDSAAGSAAGSGDSAAGSAALAALVRRRRLKIGLVVAVLVAVGGFVLVQGLRNATLFFRNADEAISQRYELGERRFRLQGRVVPSTVASEGGVTTFEVLHNCQVVSVRHTTDPPELFTSPWIPVVLEGTWTPGSVVNSSGEDTHYFLSDRMLVKHTNEYVAANEERTNSATPEGLLDDCSPELRAAAS